MIWLGILVTCSCQSLPPPPKGKICVFGVEEMASHCSVISQNIISEIRGIYKLNIQEIQTQGDQIPVTEMNNWITTDPDSWANIEAYINKLKSRLENK
jgi:hypothetical protein